MPVRHPPKNNVPPVMRRRAPRVVKYRAPAEGFVRRWLRRIFRLPVVVILVLLTTFCVGVLGYYYWIFSARVDRLISGEIFTRSAGIYAAPKELRVGGEMTAEELVALLQRANYVERAKQADEARGRYAVNGASVEVEPGPSAKVDGQLQFPRLRVAFNRGGKSVAAITELGTNRALNNAPLEPEVISSFTGEGRQKRRVIGFQDLPPQLVKAITVTEDRSFFDHYGINLRGIVRALVRRYDADPSSPIARQGGSSITQQLVKNLLLSPEYSLKRKLSEAYMSIILETRLDKREIFALYCNEAYLGQRGGFSINGFGEAADAYFNKDVTSLTLPESALLAGLIRSPNRYSPYKRPETAIARRNQVLDSMAEAKAISDLEGARAKSAPLNLAPAKNRIDSSEAPYFVDYVEQQLSDILADARTAEHLRIYTTIDMNLQRAAYVAVTKQLAALDKIYAKRFPPGTLQAALVAMNAETGEIVAMVGGRDYEKSQLNRATEALRQPGSVFKPFVYAAALNTAYDPIPRVITAATTYMDEPKTFTFDNQEYSPGNFGDTYTNAPMTLRDAIVHSKNVITVDVATEVTIGRVMNLAAQAGLPKPPRAFPAMALGTNEATPLQVAAAYTTFAADGKRASPVAINRVTTGRGSTVAAPVTQKKDVLRPAVAYIMTSFMKDVVNRGTAARLRARGFKFNVAGKTGTSRDGWFAGYTPKLVCAVWVGFDDNSQLGLTGADSALPIWSDFMSAALNAHPEWQGDWAMPSGVEQIEIDTRTGMLPAAAVIDANGAPLVVKRRTELFISGTAPTIESEETEAIEEGDSQMPEGPSGETDLALPDAPEVSEEDLASDPAPRPRTPDASSGLRGTITLDIDPTTGLIAAPTCPIIRSKTFPIGQEPRRYCGPEYHDGKTIQPAATRPRIVN